MINKVHFEIPCTIFLLIAFGLDELSGSVVHIGIEIKQ